MSIENLPSTTEAESTGTGTTPTTATSPAQDRQKQLDEFMAAIQACKTYRRKLVANWTTNIDYRRGKPFASQSDEDRIAVNIDWSMTKAKQAALFSQVPQIRVDHSPQTQAAGEWLTAYEQRLNDTLRTAGIESAMDEALPDCINAAGIGAILIAHEAITEQVQIPTQDPLTGLMGAASTPDLSDPAQVATSAPPMTALPRIVDHRYTITRISPADLLWPINFTGSDFDQSPWIGRSGRITWAQAVTRFNLTDNDRNLILGDDRTTLDRLTHDIDKDKVVLDEMVGFDEIFYKEFQYDTEAKSYTTIHHLVFVTGKNKPVIDEPWKGQEIDPTTYQPTGAQRFPIRALTLTYVTDETVPPSDSAIGRPQVNEINKSRTQMIQQRERSLPVRTVDVNRVDPAIQQSLMRGQWQAMIPVQGDGSKIITEVARATMPPENFRFDDVAKSDLANVWQIGGDQTGSIGSSETKGEANIVQNNFQTRIGQERAKVAKFVVGIAEVVGGLLCLYEPAMSFGPGFDPKICKALNYSILTDSTVLLDSNQRLKRLIDFINFAAKSGMVNVAVVLREIATLSGLDPNVVIQPPMPKPPVEPNISLRLTGVEDMMNPLTLAFLIKSGQAPPPQMIEMAKGLIQQAVTAPGGVPPNTPPPGAGPTAGGPAIPVPPGVAPPPPVPALPPSPVAPPPIHVPPPAPPAIGQAHPEWALNSHITQRRDEVGGKK